MLQFQIATYKTVGGVGFLSIFVPLHRWLTIQDWLWWAHLKCCGFYFTFIWLIAFLVDLQYSSSDKLITIFEPFFSKILLLVTHHKYSKLTSHFTRHKSHVARHSTHVTYIRSCNLPLSHMKCVFHSRLRTNLSGSSSRFFRKFTYVSSHVTRHHLLLVTRHTSHDTRHACGH